MYSYINLCFAFSSKRQLGNCNFTFCIGPASPIVERPSPLPGGGLNISWKSDVTSRQEEYEVVFVRNDTQREESIKTRTPRIKLENLYPGAGYEIKVCKNPYKVWHYIKCKPKIDV